MKYELRGFVAGLLCGGILVATVWAGSVWWKSRSEDVWISADRSPQDATLYDACLVGQNGNTVACDAYMRMIDRFRREAALKEKAAALLAGGFSKREVFDWAMENKLGFKGSLEAAGISEKDYHADNY